jgi:hypothetical protein
MPRSWMMMMIIGVIAKVAKKAVAPANLKGSFLFNSEKDSCNKFTIELMALVAFVVIDGNDIKSQ